MRAAGAFALVSMMLAASAKNIVELALATPDLSTLVVALKAGDLVTTLEGTGPFTVFAPTNEAFAALPPGVLTSLLKPENKAKLVDILTYHVAAGNVSSSQLTDGEKIPTVEGDNVIAHVSSAAVMINNAKVTAPDNYASNGVVHIIDAVLLPPAKTVKKCLALADRSASDLGYAISIVCDPKRFDCSPINEGGANYYPNDIYAHCNWAFSQYFAQKGNNNDSFCVNGTDNGIPAGKAGIFECSTACTKCQIKNGTSVQAASDIIGYLCNGQPQILGTMCAPIRPGGSLENATVVEQASYVANLYYQPVACDLGKSACDFKGNGEIVSC